jgi:hypothetical protein
MFFPLPIKESSDKFPMGLICSLPQNQKVSQVQARVKKYHPMRHSRTWISSEKNRITNWSGAVNVNFRVRTKNAKLCAFSAYGFIAKELQP